MDEETREALEGLGAALGAEPEGLPDDPLEALIAVVDGSGGDAVWRREAEEDPYAQLVLALAPAPAELEVATRIAELEPFETAWWQHTEFYVDRIPDPEGRHRVYLRDEEALPGGPWTTLPTIRALAEAWTKRASGEEGAADWPAPLEDEWEQGPTSGGFVLEAMIQASLSSQWALASVGAYVPSRPELAEEPLPVTPDDPARVLCLHALRVLRLAGRFTLPEGVALDELPAGARAYIEHLRELEGAFAGQEPPLVLAAAAQAGPLRKAARAWLKGFRDAADRPAADVLEPEEAAPPPELTDFEKRLQASVDEVLGRLIASGDLEVIDRARLLEELTRVAADARSLKHLLKKLVKTLVHSDAVEEIYATDDQLREELAKSLGDI